MARKDGEGRGAYEEPRGSGTYRIEYVDQTGHRKRETAGHCRDAAHGTEGHRCPVQKAAVRLAKERRKQVKEARLFPAPPAPPEQPTLMDAIERFLEESRAMKRTWNADRRFAKVWGNAMGDRFLGDIKAADIERWRRKKLVEPLRTAKGKVILGEDGEPKLPRPATANRYVAFLKRVFNVAIRDELCEKNPCTRVRELRENNIRTRHLSPEEEQALRAAFPENLWHIVFVAVNTGLRQAEQLSLRWDRVDFASCEITIPRSKHGECRHVPMSEDVVEVLRRLPSRMRSEWVYPAPPLEGRPGRKSKPCPHMTFSSIRPAFERAVEKAALGDVHWHDLRRTFCSRLAMSGVDMKTIQDIMGHRSLAMIQRYAHLSPGHRQAAVGKLKAFYAEQTSQEPPKSPEADAGTA